MDNSKALVGPFQELVLEAILDAGSEAYGICILERVTQFVRRPVSLGAVYTTLSRLEQHGYVSSCLGDSTPQRGGKRKKYFSVEEKGKTVLAQLKEMRARLPQPILSGPTAETA